MNRPLISIVNSSTFGKHFIEHISTLEKFADIQHVTVPADIDADALAEKIKDSDGIIASVTPRFRRKTLEQCTKLKLLARHGIGCDNVDLMAATELGIQVSRVKGIVEREAVAEYAVGTADGCIKTTSAGIAGSKKQPVGKPFPHGRYGTSGKNDWHHRSWKYWFSFRRNFIKRL